MPKPSTLSRGRDREETMTSAGATASGLGSAGRSWTTWRRHSGVVFVHFASTATSSNSAIGSTMHAEAGGDIVAEVISGREDRPHQTAIPGGAFINFALADVGQITRDGGDLSAPAGRNA